MSQTAVADTAPGASRRSSTSSQTPTIDGNAQQPQQQQQQRQRSGSAGSVHIRTLFIAIATAGSLAIAATAVVPLSVEWRGRTASFARVARHGIDTQAAILRRLVVDKARDSFAQEIAKPVQLVDTALQRVEFLGVDVTAIPSMHDAALASPLLFSVGISEMMSTAVFSTFVRCPCRRCLDGRSSTDAGAQSIITSNDHGHHLLNYNAVAPPSRVNWGVYDQHERNGTYAISVYNTTTFTPTNASVSQIVNWPITTRPFWPLVTNRSGTFMWSMIYDTAARAPRPFYARRIPRDLCAHDGILAISFKLLWLTDYFASLRITEHSFAMVFEDTPAMGLIALSEGTVVAPSGLVTYTTANHPNATVRRPAELWLARTGGVRRELSFTADDKYHDVSLLAIPGGTGWWMLLVSPVSDFTGSAETAGADEEQSTSTTTIAAVAACAAALVVALCSAIAAIVTVVTREISQVTRHLHNLSEMKFDSKCPSFSSKLTELCTMQSTASQMTVALESFSVYVPTTVVHWLIRNNRKPELSMEQKLCTVMFLDVAQFTATMEQYSVKVVFKILQTMFETFSAILTQNQATIDKYIGDAIMAVWNVPERVKEHQMLACRSAVQMCEALDQMNVEFEKEIGKRMAIRIGINSGPVFCGNVGSSSRMNYTVIGDTVNMAARLEDVNRDLGSTVCITDAGFKTPVRVHEILGIAGSLSDSMARVLADYKDIDKALLEAASRHQQQQQQHPRMDSDRDDAPAASRGLYTPRLASASPVGGGGDVEEGREEPTQEFFDRVEFLLELCAALHRYGMHTHRIESQTAVAAQAFDIEAAVAVFPNYISATFRPQGSHRRYTYNLSAESSWDLEKLELTDDLVARTATRRIGLAEGVAQLRALQNKHVLSLPPAVPPRYQWWAKLICMTVMSGSVCPLYFRGGVTELFLSLCCGLLSGLLLLVSVKTVSFGRLLEPLVALVCALLATVVAVEGWMGPVFSTCVMLSGVVWLLPGLLINKSVADLATNNMVSGAAHMLYAMLVIFELAFGLALGSRITNLISLPADDAASASAAAAVPPRVALPISPWFDIVWTPVAACSIAVMLGAAPRQLPAILVCGAFASLVQVLRPVFGKELATMITQAIIVLTGNIYARVYDKPTFIPTCVGSLMLMIGALGARGVTSSIMLDNHIVLSMNFTFAVVITSVCMLAGGFVANMILYPKLHKPF
eukprot:m51a1_g7417 hypothetical protein (1207) ;mRNA; f:224643-229901